MVCKFLSKHMFLLDFCNVDLYSNAHEVHRANMFSS
jgi:hypothetical protein